MEKSCLGYEMAEIKRGMGGGETEDGIGPLADQYNNHSAGSSRL